MKQKIGVYICHCGGNISDYVDVNKVRKAIEQYDGVELVKDIMFTCSDAAQVEMVDDIKDQSLDGMVVASCSPKLHLATFRDVANRAGLNPYNYVHANIREQCSWAHSHQKEGATDKAIKLIHAAVNKVALSKSLDQYEIDAKNVVAVVGAGVSGLRAALELSGMGTEVYLIEKDHFIGGRISQWGNVFNSDKNSDQIVKELYDEVKSRNNITLFTGATIESVEGSIGNFDLNLKIKPRYVKDECDQNEMEKAMQACPVEIPDEFEFGLRKKKAIYKNGNGAVPATPAIDMEYCTKCGDCVALCPEAVDLEQREESITAKVGTVMLTTGFDPYTPESGEFGYQTSDNVITLHEFKRILQHQKNGKLNFNGKEVKSVAYIYCVGSRQEDGDNKYCSRYCCTGAVHTATEVKKAYPNVVNYHITRGVRTYGKQEIIYAEASKQGDIFMQTEDDNLPIVEAKKGKTSIKVTDLLTNGLEVEVQPDLVVLVSGMKSRNNKQLENILKVPLGSDKFYNEVHAKLRPVEIVIDGIYIAGSCQGPKNISESVQSTLAATAKANALISSGTIKLEPIFASVDPNKCVFCKKCIELCSYGALSEGKEGDKDVAVVNNALCKGCGACAPVCEQDAIEVTTFTNKEIQSTIDALLEDAQLSEEIEEIREASGEADDERNRQYAALPEICKEILEALKEEPKNVPDIAKAINKKDTEVLYNLMSLRKYGFVMDTDEIDEDEYYLYQVKN